MAGLTIAFKTRDSLPVATPLGYEVLAKITFDDSYPTGGESLTAASLNLPPNYALSFVTAHPSAGYVFEYDYTNFKLIAYRSAGFTPAGTVAAHTHDLFLKNADVADSAGARVNAGTNLLGANTGSNITVTGLAAGATTHGGVQGIAAASLTGTAVAAAALVEVAAAVDLQLVSTRLYAIATMV